MLSGLGARRNSEVASIYGGCGGTANGERLNCAAMTAAHRSLVKIAGGIRGANMTAVARGCTPLFWMLCKGARVMPASASRLVLILHPHPQHISEFPSMTFPFTRRSRAAPPVYRIIAYRLCRVPAGYGGRGVLVASVQSPPRTFRRVEMPRDWFPFALAATVAVDVAVGFLGISCEVWQMMAARAECPQGYSQVRPTKSNTTQTSMTVQPSDSTVPRMTM